MSSESRTDLVHDLIFPTLLFAALGGMSWAVRGSSGYGGSAGCIFAGVLWGAAWWYLSRTHAGERPRRYTSAWIVLAVTFGVGVSGARGWMQWPSFFEGKLQTNYPYESVPISRVYGFVWLFIAGMPWAGIGACLLAWCGSLRETRWWHWYLRFACAIGGAIVARWLFDRFPQYFLPLYTELEDRYHDLDANPNLRRLINDSGSAIAHLGIYLALLAYEAVRREGKNVVLIASVGLVNGVGWALLQNWKWAPDVWPGANFNWWRCWESSGGISIGLAYGVAYFLANRRVSQREVELIRTRRSIEGPTWEWLAVFLLPTTMIGFFMYVEEARWGLAYAAVVALFGVAYVLLYRNDPRLVTSSLPGRGDPNLQRWAMYVGLLFGLGLSARNGLKGWFNLYRGDEDYYSAQLWHIFGPGMLVLLVAISAWILLRPLPRDFRGELFPRANWLMWLVLLVTNVLAQMITGPLTVWNEFAFNIYYALLFLIAVAIVLEQSARWKRSHRVADDRTTACVDAAV